MAAATCGPEGCTNFLHADCADCGRHIRASYRMNRRADGTPCRGYVNHPEGKRVFCAPCCDARVEARKLADRTERAAKSAATEQENHQ